MALLGEVSSILCSDPGDICCKWWVGVIVTVGEDVGVGVPACGCLDFVGGGVRVVCGRSALQVHLSHMHAMHVFAGVLACE